MEQQEKEKQKGGRARETVTFKSYRVSHHLLLQKIIFIRPLAIPLHSHANKPALERETERERERERKIKRSQFMLHYHGILKPELLY